MSVNHLLPLLFQVVLDTISKVTHINTANATVVLVISHALFSRVSSKWPKNQKLRSSLMQRLDLHITCCVWSNLSGEST